jgi:hypothetical protein
LRADGVYNTPMGLIEMTLGRLIAVARVGAIGQRVPAPLPILQVAAGRRRR